MWEAGLCPQSSTPSSTQLRYAIGTEKGPLTFFLLDHLLISSLLSSEECR